MKKSIADDPILVVVPPAETTPGEAVASKGCCDFCDCPCRDANMLLSPRPGAERETTPDDDAGDAGPSALADEGGADAGSAELREMTPRKSLLMVLW